MLSSSSNDMCNKGLGKNEISISEPQGKKKTSDDRPCKIRRTSSLSYIRNLPADCLHLIFKCLKTREDSNSFGLTCRQWHHIQNNSVESLLLHYSKYSSDGNFLEVLCKMLCRFPHLKNLCVIFREKKMRLPEITNSGIADKGLEALAKCCLLLEKVTLVDCDSITDSGVSFLLRNCRKLSTLILYSCNNITGIGFLGCPQTLTQLEADKFKLTPEGIGAIVSGGGLEYLRLFENAAKVNTETIMTISKGCPLLKELSLSDCEEVELQGWQAIGQNCKNLELLLVLECKKLRDMGLEALRNRYNKFSIFSADGGDNCTFTVRCRDNSYIRMHIVTLGYFIH
ncbi:hypothetical protein MKW98_030138 [Papaver atlanticum]|uniref:F-box domain-containing protein n=1 Tax=Papaver atlanticum TaxID=357466 RepID=A0AAD4XRW7_9MAGN|nr:hypothetical protein MKW98_030138 [Papaver atlanticum]